MKKPSAPSKAMPIRMQKQNALGGMAPLKRGSGMAAQGQPMKKGGMAKGKTGC